MRRGERVVTPQGPGAVVYVRMRPPEYRDPAAVSVMLDARRDLPGYMGTIFNAADVRPE